MRPMKITSVEKFENVGFIIFFGLFCNKGGWGIKQLSPVFSPPFYFILSPTTVIPHFPHRVFGVDFPWGWGYSGEKKERYFFFIPHYNYPPFFEKKKLAIFFILSAILPGH